MTDDDEFQTTAAIFDSSRRSLLFVWNNTITSTETTTHQAISLRARSMLPYPLTVAFCYVSAYEACATGYRLHAVCSRPPTQFIISYMRAHNYCSAAAAN